MQHVENIYISHQAEDESQEVERQESIGKTYLEMSKVFAKANDTENAIQFQTKAFDVFQRIEKYADTEYLGMICTTLSEY